MLESSKGNKTNKSGEYRFVTVNLNPNSILRTYSHPLMNAGYQICLECNKKKTGLFNRDYDYSVRELTSNVSINVSSSNLKEALLKNSDKDYLKLSLTLFKQEVKRQVQANMNKMIQLLKYNIDYYVHLFREKGEDMSKAPDENILAVYVIDIMYFMAETLVQEYRNTWTLRSIYLIIEV